MYSTQVLDHFQNPRHVGEVEHASAVVEVQNPVCGDQLRLSARLAEGRLAEVRFRAKGCVPAIACGSRLTELMLDRSLAEVKALRREELVASLGGLPEASTHAGHLAMDALHQLLRRLG